MRKTLTMLLLLLAAAAALAQEQATWQEVAPPGEEFAVLMPARGREVSRVLPLADKLNLARPVYEVSAGGLHFMVVSFEKWGREGQPALLKNFEDFSKGFENAVRNGRRKDGNTVESDEDFTLKGLKIRSYRISMSGRQGVARLYEAPKHFYAVVVLGATDGDAHVDRFIKSFKVKTGESEPQRRDGPDDLSALKTMTDPVPVDSTPRHAPPEGPWPIAHPASGLRAPVSGGVLNGKATSKPQPAYPQVGLQGRAQGMVTVQLTIDEKGNVISARAISGHPLLQQAAVEAARKARFAPTRLNGTPVKVTGVITYNFVLEDAPD